MELEQAIQMLKKAVKGSAVEDQNHIDLTLIAAEERDAYKEALMVTQMAIREGSISKEDFNRKLRLK